MPDPYVPNLETFILSADEQHAIELALAEPKPWDWKPGGQLATTIKAVKDRIRELQLLRHNHRCCYCRRDLHRAGHFMIDREHVLPKSIDAYRLLAFTLWNIGASCKRCNMEFKGDKIDFVVDQTATASLKDTGNYLLIHPNFDRYKDHLSRIDVADDDVVVVKFFRKEGSAKGAYTYDFFDLAGLERDMADVAQGSGLVEDPSEAGFEVRRLAEDYGQ